MTKKSTSTRPLKKTQNWSPVRAARNRGAEGSQGAFMTRSREDGLARCPIKKNLNGAGNGTSSASVAMCEAFLNTCAHTHTSDLSHTWDS
jgi:hypothetical protein